MTETKSTAVFDPASGERIMKAGGKMEFKDALKQVVKLKGKSVMASSQMLTAYLIDLAPEEKKIIQMFCHASSDHLFDKLAGCPDEKNGYYIERAVSQMKEYYAEKTIDRIQTALMFALNVNAASKKSADSEKKQDQSGSQTSKAVNKTELDVKKLDPLSSIAEDDLQTILSDIEKIRYLNPQKYELKYKHPHPENGLSSIHINFTERNPEGKEYRVDYAEVKADGAYTYTAYMNRNQLRTLLRNVLVKLEYPDRSSGEWTWAYRPSGSGSASSEGKTTVNVKSSETKRPPLDINHIDPLKGITEDDFQTILTGINRIKYLNPQKYELTYDYAYYQTGLYCLRIYLNTDNRHSNKPYRVNYGKKVSGALDIYEQYMTQPELESFLRNILVKRDYRDLLSADWILVYSPSKIAAKTQTVKTSAAEPVKTAQKGDVSGYEAGVFLFCAVPFLNGLLGLSKIMDMAFPEMLFWIAALFVCPVITLWGERSVIRTISTVIVGAVTGGIVCEIMDAWLGEGSDFMPVFWVLGIGFLYLLQNSRDESKQ